MRKADKYIIKDYLFYGKPQEEELRSHYLQGWYDCTEEYKKILEYNNNYYRTGDGLKKPGILEELTSYGWILIMFLLGIIFTLVIEWICG